ncbi:hypothetical protein F5141DRAFT_1127968 [Pisolithus sp. B1]|nr:hypothetical protein F5141DRAFT_1127968 [Pisolithus sp. B1]
MLFLRLLSVGQTMGSTDRISVRTTTNADGMIAVIDPKPSWVGLWQRTCESLRPPSLLTFFFCIESETSMRDVRGQSRWSHSRRRGSGARDS